MEKVYLIDSVYEDNNRRIILFFSKNPHNKKHDFILKEKFNPYFFIDLDKKVVLNLLSEFKKDILVKEENNVLKIISKDNETLKKCYKILSMSTNKKIILLEPERQYLIDKNWSYYDIFLIISRNKIKKIEINNLNYIVNKYISPFLKEEQIRIIEGLTRKLLLENILKKKIDGKTNISQIMNILFENLFFENKIPIENQVNIEFLKKAQTTKEDVQINFSNIWPYLLTKSYYNISYDTLNCNCCKPKSYLETNTLSNSLISVNFKRDGFYFISKDNEWSYNYHSKNKLKEQRLNYKKDNYLKEIPTGPFFKKENLEIPLIDAISLLKEDLIEINDFKKIKWYCLKKESFISKTISNLLERLKNIEKSINLSNSMIYKNSFKNSNHFEKNPMFIQYLTEYKLINDLIEEIPKFLEHKNTKFYNKEVSQSIKYIKYETVQKIDNDKKYLIEKDRIIFKDKKIIEKINIFFPKLNLPIPKIITG